MFNTRYHASLGILFCTLLGLYTGSGAEGPSEQPARQYRTIARWYGQISGYEQTYASFGKLGSLVLAQQNMLQRTSVSIVLREEVDSLSGIPRTVVESFSWSSGVTDLYYVNRDGSHIPAGKGGSASRSFSEKDLVGEPIPPDPQSLVNVQRDIEETQQELAVARQELATARQELAAAATQAEQAGPETEGTATGLLEAWRHYDDAYDVWRRGRSAVNKNALWNERSKTHKALGKVTRDYSQQHLAPQRKQQYKQLEDKYLPRMQALGQQLANPQLGDEDRQKMSEEEELLRNAYNDKRREVSARRASEELPQRTADLEQIERDLERLQRELAAMQSQRVLHAQANADVFPGRAPGEKRAHVSFQVNTMALLKFEADVIPLKREGFSTVLSDKYKPTVFTASFSFLPFSGFTEEAFITGDDVVVSWQRQRRSGEPDRGGREWAVQAQFRRVPVEQQVAVRGTILHRLRIPTPIWDAGAEGATAVGAAATATAVGAAATATAVNLNLVRIGTPDGSTPISLEGALPVTGKVKVEAWLLSAGESVSASRPPEVTVYSQAEDGSFELSVPPQRDRRLHLRFTYHNEPAQLQETNELEVEMERLLDAAGANSSSAVPLEDIVRTSIAHFRWKNATQQYTLGLERRGAAIRREGNRTVLQFEGFNAILINTFVLQAPYLNQNLQGFQLSRIKVPAARLLQARPSFISEAAVRQRLEVPGDGAVPDETETTVPIRGTVVCFPTSLTMALAGLGLLKDVQTPQGTDVRDLAQAIYDFHAEESRRHVRGPRYPEPPWLFPFPKDPAQANAIVQHANQQLLDSLRTDISWTLSGTLPDWATADHVVVLYAHWPFHLFPDASSNEAAKQWLISLEANTPKHRWFMTSTGSVYGEVLEREALRPWQDANIVQAYLDKRFGASTIHMKLRQDDPFAAGWSVINLLGRGGVAIVSIDHRAWASGKGGHLIVLLGAIIDHAGSIVRLIVHDPYGDQSRNPNIEGYYNLADRQDHSKYDKDPSAFWGAYAPYSSEINSYDGRLYGKYWLQFERPGVADANALRQRLLPSQPTSHMPGM